jgi:anaerobic selenocysteine-containing dehydrogenase
VTGKRSLILPCFARTDEDIVKGKKQFTTVEDAMGKIGFSQGCLTPLSASMKSEIEIVAGLASATVGNKNIEWPHFANDYHTIRSAMAEVIPAFGEISVLKPTSKVYYVENPLRKREFKTNSGKAQFSNYWLEKAKLETNELFLMTIRSHDQFNTSVFGLNDRYRGISNERRVLFMNSDDMADRCIAPQQLVEIISRYDDRTRKLEGYYVIPYPIRRGCVAAYFPETNLLTSINSTNPICETPAYKSVRVLVKPIVK